MRSPQFGLRIYVVLRSAGLPGLGARTVRAHVVGCRPETPSDRRADIARMHWAYYVLIAAAAIVLLNVILVVYLAIVSRERHPPGRNEHHPLNET
jgi:hypothetical protein